MFLLGVSLMHRPRLVRPFRRTFRPLVEVLEDRSVPSYTVHEFALPNPDSVPDIIKAGPDGNLWFNEGNQHELGRISPSGQITEVTLPASIGSGYFAFGPDGNIWIGSHTDIAEITPQGVLLRDYAIPAAANPAFDFSSIPVALGPDGNIWYTEPYVSDGNDVIGRLTPDGQITEFHVGGAFRGWADIITGPDGNLWF